ncbi:MAG TPA: hypothetical protein VH054_14550, partial [Polyangiaceae bacterium]|nr:hypothetical protein [Polyangiaceae bacterium]
QTWASARGLRLVAPSEGGQHAIAVDPAIASHVEEDLRVAREMTAQHDADRAERALARAEALLRAHPEIPQAAWLLAEVERGWAARFSQLEPRDVERAARHWRAAAALDGGRAPGVGEPTTANDPVTPFSIDARGPAQHMWWDGELITAGSHEARAGMHQLVAKVNDEVVFAQWINVTAGTAVHVALPSAEPCSRADFEAQGTVQCPSWIQAKRGDRAGTFFVRTCAGSACGADLLVASLSSTGREIPPITRHHGLPVWAAWTLAGVGIVAAGVAASVIGYAATPVTIVHRTETNGRPQ